MSRFVDCRLSKTSVLMLMGAFWPGHEANGPNQSLIALCRALKNDFEFTVLARDRAFDAPASGTAQISPFQADYAQIRYLRIGAAHPLRLRSEIKSVRHDLIILNGFFDREFTIPYLLMRRSGIVPRTPTILSPRGEFSPGALQLRAGPKRRFTSFARRTGLLDGVTLHATGQREAAEIRRALPYAGRLAVAANLTAPLEPLAKIQNGEGSELRLAYLSRIDRKKNLSFALEVLRQIQAPTRFDIFGPVSDAGYWEECRRSMQSLPPNVKVHYLGELPHDRVHVVIKDYDAFFLPTLGENFGHAIVEALAAGCPVIISDQTPWRQLRERCAGWDLPLDDPRAFVRAIAELDAMRTEERQRLRRGARALAEEIVDNGKALADTEAMFRDAIIHAT